MKKQYKKIYFNLRPDQIVDTAKEKKRLKLGLYETQRRIYDLGLKAIKKVK